MMFRSLQYIDKLNKETFFSIDNAPPNMQKKKTLLEYFHDYMNEHLLKVSVYVNTTPNKVL